ncbi:MAG TPA: MFS transporter [Geminicoccaceae bacterium]
MRAAAGRDDPAGSSGYRHLLQDGRFARIWLIGGVAGTLRWLEMLAVGVFTFQTTGSPAMVALMTFMRLGPMLFAGLPMGALAERHDRKRLMEIGLAVLCLANLAIALLALADRLALWHLALGALLNGIFFTSEFPVRRTMIGEIVGTPRLAAAMALDSMTSNATRALGPVLGGVLLEATGLAGTFALGAFGYGLALLLVRPLAYRPASPPRRVAILAGMREGLGFAARSRTVRTTLLITVIFNVFGFAYIALVPVVGERWLGLGATLIGVLMAAEGTGSLFGAILVGWLARPARYTRIYVGGTLLFLGAIVVFALSRDFTLSLAALFVSGFGVAGFAVMQSTLTFLTAPPRLRSRLMGVLTVAIGTGPLGMLAIGWIAEVADAPDAILLFAGLGTLSLVALLLLSLDYLRIRDPAALAQADGSTSSRQATPSSADDTAG